MFETMCTQEKEAEISNLIIELDLESVLEMRSSQTSHTAGTLDNHQSRAVNSKNIQY